MLIFTFNFLPGERYYAYKMSSRWNKDKKRADKVTGEYLGVVTQDGIIMICNTKSWTLFCQF